MPLGKIRYALKGRLQQHVVHGRCSTQRKRGKQSKITRSVQPPLRGDRHSQACMVVACQVEEKIKRIFEEKCSRDMRVWARAIHKKSGGCGIGIPQDAERAHDCSSASWGKFAK